MTTFKITVEYDGTRYSGWQEQKNARLLRRPRVKLGVFDARGHA